MISNRLVHRLIFVCALAGGCAGTKLQAASCVWKVTGPNGGSMFLGGSVHVLQKSDYPLPAAYDRAFDASSRLVFEYDPKEMSNAYKGYLKAGEYPKGDSLKNHVDPRTYAYLRKFFGLLGVSEDKFRSYRPWFIELMLSAPPPENSALGVEGFLTRRARAKSKPISGLETMREGIETFSGMSDRQSEAVLLLFFVNLGRDRPGGRGMLSAWRQGDTETLARLVKDAFSEVPGYHERLIDRRNRKWLGKIDGCVQSGKTYFVVAGAGHMGGSQGLLALLKGRGYRIEQL